MMPSMKSTFAKLRHEFSDRFLAFKPYVKPLPIAGCSIRFFYGTPQAADWYDPLKPRNRRELEWLAARIAGQKHKIVDAGAYHGLYTLVFAGAAGAGSEVVAIDPVASNCALIEVKLALNGLHARIEPCAVGASDGEVSVSANSCARIVERGGIRLPSRRLSSILAEATIVKVDIEGAEFEVVPAQIDDLPDARVWIVEIHPRRDRNPDLVLDAFRARPFDLWWGDPATGQIEPYRAQPWKTRATLIAIRRD
jgi:FkbM family methyltransferase